jgi:endonuclease/exonuclease/phosphatase family metal-dependent hydrolase
MSKQDEAAAQAAREVAGFLKRLPPKTLITLLVLVAAVAGIVYLASRKADPNSQPLPPGTYLFCSWNVENFYDDEADPKSDDKLEAWFAHNPDMFRLKVDHLAEALLWMNDGRGPDIVAMYEVESERCINALKDALNQRLAKDGKEVAQYQHVLFLGDKTGRRFAPGILTRLPIEADRTHRFTDKGPDSRNIEGHIKANGHDLAVLAAHWTSRVEHGGKNGEEHANAERRMSYAKACYGRFKAILKANPDADVILCGDFNDEFTDPSIQHGLHASGNVEEVRNAIDEPRPLDLFAHWSGEPPGTIEYKGRWSIFDHICVSRGLLDDKGWSVIPDSASIFAPREMRHRDSRGHEMPFRFGDARDAIHGYSDHFPVTVRLKLN